MPYSPYSTWLMYVLTLQCLGLAEGFIHPENGLLDSAVDSAIILIGCLGAIVSWIVSYRSIYAPAINISKRRINVAVTWILGPVAGVTVAIWPASDIDGGLLLFYPPVVGVFLTVFVLPILFMVETK